MKLVFLITFTFLNTLILKVKKSLKVLNILIKNNTVNCSKKVNMMVIIISTH